MATIPSTAERGVHAVAERYAYDKQSEKFVFLQGAYQEFAETVNMLLQNVSREDLAAASSESMDINAHGAALRELNESMAL